MYKLNKNSWHYKLVKEFGSDDFYFEYGNKKHIPLCPYVRQLLFAFGAFLFTTTVLITVLGFVLSSIGIFLADMLNFTNIDLSDKDTKMLGIMYGCGLVFLMSILTSFLVSEHKNSKALKEYNKELENKLNIPKKIKEPNIFMLYLKSVHNKICPLMEVEDNV